MGWMLHFLITVSNSGDTTDRQPADADARPLNARSLALSALLGTHPPELPARSFVALAALFGTAGGAMRTALSRMVASGEVTLLDGRYRLAGALVDRQIAQDAGRRPPAGAWDGRWHSVVAAAGHRDLAERRHFRGAMHNHRFGELRPDIWMRPANLPLPRDIEGLIATTGELDGVTSDELARRLWDLAAIGTEAHHLLGALDRLDGETGTTTDWDDPRSIPDVFTTSATVVRFLRTEPQLPRRLEPDDWPVHDLRARYDAVESKLQRLLRTFLRASV